MQDIEEYERLYKARKTAPVIKEFKLQRIAEDDSEWASSRPEIPTA
jgi:hypothetical protein